VLPTDWKERDSTTLDTPGRINPPINPYHDTQGSDDAKSELRCGTGAGTQEAAPDTQALRFITDFSRDRQRSFIRLPDYETVIRDPVLYAHTSRILHLETNPSNAATLVQKHGDRYVWLNPPPIPLVTEELDTVFELPYQRVPHPIYGEARIAAYEMIRFSVNIMRGCFGGCSFCSITEHEGRVIQSRSEDSIVREIEHIRDKTPGFTGIISDLGGPTANMYQLNCKSEQIHAHCKRLSCVYPGICKNLVTDHSPTTQLYRRARQIPGIKRIFIASGLRYDLAIEDPEYIKELVTHHVGGYLKIAPEHTEDGPLSRMMKPGIGTYHRFKELFDHFSAQAGKKQYLIPYFIAAHPGTRDEDMMNLALWLKQNGFRADQVQTFYPSPMASATAMYHSEYDPLHRIDRRSAKVPIPKGLRQRRLHKAFLRYHDPENWPMLREALKSMGKAHLIGYGKKHLVPPTQPVKPTLDVKKSSATSKMRKGQFHTQHTGLPPRTGAEVQPQGKGRSCTRKPR
jgi:uncharacterized radical SAM protein YgiQ